MGGGQFKQALKTIIDAEKQPIKTLEGRKANEEARLKLFGEFKGKFGGLDKALNEMANFSSFRELKVDLGDGKDQVTVTIDKTKAQPGSYEVQIDELARRSSVLSNGFSDPNEPVLGMGFITMDTPDGKVEVFVEDKDSSLNGIMRAINAQKNSPIRAAVVKDVSDADEPWRLILSSKSDGADHHVDFPEFYFLENSTQFWFDNDREAQNALVKIDGFEMELESNDVKDFLPGVNLHMRQARPDQPFFVTITEDPQKIAGKMKNLVDQVNEILKFITTQNTVDEKSDTKNTFAGDTSLQTIEYRLRNVLHEGFPVYDNKEDPEQYRLLFLNNMGVEFDKKGQLNFNEAKFTKALENDFVGISEAITGEDWGFATQLKKVLADYTKGGDGLLAIREKGIRNRISAIDRQIDDKTRLVDRKQQALTEQFSRLQGTLANLQRQQQYLQATLPAAGGGGMIQQLLGG